MAYTNSAVASAPKPTVANDDSEVLRDLYLESLQLVERLHRRLLDVIKDEFDRANRTDINAIQALLLFNIGNSELTAGELRSRGYYLGETVAALYDRHINSIAKVGGIGTNEFEELNKLMQRLDRFWNDQIQYRL